MLIFEVKDMFVCLFPSLEIFNCLSSLLEEVLILKAFLLGIKSLILGGVFHLGVILLLLGRNPLFTLVGVLVGVPLK